jgi:hypothetical protein
MEGSVLMGRNGNLAAKNIRVMRAASAEIHTGSDTTITVDLSQDDNEVELCASTLEDKAIEIVEEAAVDASDNTAAEISRDNTAVTALLESDILESNHARVDSLAEPSDTTLYSCGELDETMGEVEKSDNLTVDVAGQWNNKTLDKLVGADKATGQPGESVAIELLDARDPTPFDYDMKSAEVDGVEMFGVGDSIEAAATLSTLSHANISPSFGNLGGWQIVDLPRTPLPNGRGGSGTAKSKVSTGIDRKELLKGWDWVFRRR